MRIIQNIFLEICQSSSNEGLQDLERGVRSHYYTSQGDGEYRKGCRSSGYVRKVMTLIGDSYYNFNQLHCSNNLFISKSIKHLTINEYSLQVISNFRLLKF